MPLFAHPVVGFVVEKAGIVQRGGQVLDQRRHVEVTGQLDERRAQVKIGCFPVEQVEHLNKDRRDDERGVRVTVRVADEQTGPFA